MRKLFIGFLLFLSLTATAQIKIGLQGGINLSNFMHGSRYSGDTRKSSAPHLIRFNAGVLVQIPLNDNWSIYTGSHYSGKGSGSGRQFFSSKRDTIRTFLNYIELPLSIAYKFSEGRETRFVVGAGIYGSYGFNGKVLYRNDPTHTELHLHKKDKQYKRIDMGFSINAGYEINEKYGVRLDYTRSLFDISRYKWKETNNVLKFSFFLYFGKIEKTD